MNAVKTIFDEIIVLKLFLTTTVLGSETTDIQLRLSNIVLAAHLCAQYVAISTQAAANLHVQEDLMFGQAPRVPAPNNPYLIRNPII